MDCFAVRSRWNCTSDWKAAAECWDSGLLCSHRIASRVAQLFKRARAHCVAAPVFPVALRAQPARLLRHNSVLSLLPDYKIATCGQQMLYQDLGLRSRVSTFVRMRIHFWWTGTILSPTAWKWLRKKYLKHFLNNYLQSQKCSPIKKKEPGRVQILWAVFSEKNKLRPVLRRCLYPVREPSSRYARTEVCSFFQCLQYGVFAHACTYNCPMLLTNRWRFSSWSHAIN